MRESFRKTLMERDGMTEEESVEAFEQVKDFMDKLIDRNGDLDELEEYLLSEFGLEGDYVEDFM